MKNARKLLALLLTVAMILSLGVTAVAASDDSASASITLNNATIGKFYHAYKLFDAVTDSSGSDGL